MYEINVSINTKLVFRCGRKLMYVQLRNGGYNIPGGHLEQGESPIDGLRRELQEELNYRLTEEPTLVGVWSRPTPENIPHLLIGFVLDVPTELNFTYTEPEEGPADCRWIEPEAIDQLGLNATFTDLMKRAANAPRHHGT